MRSRWKAVVGVVIVVLIVAYYLAFLIPVPSKESGMTLPWIAQIYVGGVPTRENTPTGYFPINKTTATTYATNLIKDYEGLVNSNQAFYLSAHNLKRFFPLYHSYQVYVARENWTQGPERIEFFFVSSPSATSTQITFFTNETAQYLRPEEIVGTNTPTNNSYDWYASVFGYYIGDLTTQSPIGVNHFDAIWITNSSSVYNDTLLNANDAAHAIYNANTQDYEYTTGPPQLLSPRWFRSVFAGLPGNIITAATFLATFIYLFEVFRGRVWPRKKRQYIRHPRRSKEPPSQSHE